MRGRGINYDTGFLPGGQSTRESFDPEVVRRELRIIADDLHCNAVRISGADPERLSVAAAHALDAGLEVWFAPFPCELTTDELLPYLDDCAARAEDLRGRSAREVVLVLGCETSLFSPGFLPGDDLFQRIANVQVPGPELFAAFGALPARLNAFLAEAAAVARRRFGGRLTYASGSWEQVDWSPFDVVAVDAYREDSNAATFRQQLERQLSHGKPVAATEFGCCTYRGAAGRGGMGWAIIDQHANPPRLDGSYVRDEGEQVGYLHDLLEIFEEAGLDSAFWFTFAGYELPHRADPEHDLDMASYGVVKVLEQGRGSAYPDMAWEPKASFHALAAAYAAAP
jgi:hypothetical protein